MRATELLGPGARDMVSRTVAQVADHTNAKDNEMARKRRRTERLVELAYDE